MVIFYFYCCHYYIPLLSIVISTLIYYNNYYCYFSLLQFSLLPCIHLHNFQNAEGKRPKSTRGESFGTDHGDLRCAIGICSSGASLAAQLAPPDPIACEKKGPAGYHNLLVLSREWVGMDGNGGMGLLLIVIMDHSLLPCWAPVG